MCPRNLGGRRTRRFSDEYFDKNKKDFNQSFLSKSLIERSGILAKVWRKTALSRRQLLGIHHKISQIFERARQNKAIVSPKDKERLERGMAEAWDIYHSLLAQNGRIFSQEYLHKIGLYHGCDASSAHMEDFHECVHQLMQIRNYYNVLALR